jgi:hypothetical protein
MCRDLPLICDLNFTFVHRVAIHILSFPVHMSWQYQTDLNLCIFSKCIVLVAFITVTSLHWYSKIWLIRNVRDQKAVFLKLWRIFIIQN